ncbi:MAG: hybrid sensor histidine kinase/response regulator [Mesorhizobium amorphae]|nr:MAG: hybrid sensor histidine kinase/response regulator [Mesorhizobium amorphae]
MGKSRPDTSLASPVPLPAAAPAEAEPGAAHWWRRMVRAAGSRLDRLAPPRHRRRLNDVPDPAQFDALADRVWELQESEERSRGLLDALGDLVVHRDRNGRILYANQVFADLLATEPRRLAGRRLEELGIRIGEMPDAAFNRTGDLSSADVAVETTEGTRWFSWIEVSVRDAATGRVTRRAIAREITPRKRAEAALIAARERAEVASQAKSRFLATVSHEIRTPMNGILGMAKLLADTELSPEQRTYLNAVSTSAGSLVALIEDLLAFSKIEAGRFELEPQAMSPRELADGVAELMSARAYAKGIGIAAFVAPDVPQTVLADPGRVRQVLLNLVGNAVKFTEQGGIRLSVSREGESALRFTVRDTGPGLKPQDRARVFEEFEQGDTTNTRAHGGTGLGLAISQGIVEAMGGVIGLDAPEPGGSCFFFTLPLAEPSAETGASPDALAGHRVVVLSRNATEARALAQTIEAHGGMAVVAPSPIEAEEAALGATALIVDAAIETREGELLRSLRARGFAQARALVAIAPDQRGTLPQFRASGYSGFLARPVRGATLLKTLASETPPAPQNDAEPARRRRRTPSRPRTLRVLVAEDNEINALLVRSALSRAGHFVEVVDNGRAAAERLTASEPHRFDCVLMDLHMPLMDGLDAVKMVRRHEDAGGHPPVPIVMLSADGQEATRHSAIALGASGFALKPLDPDALVRLVEMQEP